MRPFQNTSAVSLTFLVIALLVAAGPVEAQKKGSTVVPLRVVIQPVDSAGDFMQTTGDGVTVADSAPELPNEYVHQVDGVTAVINAQGGLTIDFQPTANSPRRVYFDYTSPVGSAVAPPAGQQVYSGLRTHLTSANSPLLNMAIPSTQCIALGTAFGYSDGSYYRNSYQAMNIASVNTTNTAFGQVTRLDVNTWLLESREGLCNTTYLHVTKLIKDVTVRNKTTYVDQGAFRMGFSMRLSRK